METKQEEYLYTLGNAIKYGLKPAILIEYFRRNIFMNVITDDYIYEGKTWHKISVADLKREFQFMSHNQVRYALQRLLEGNVLQKGVFTDDKFNRTKCYTFTDPEEIFKCYDQNPN